MWQCEYSGWLTSVRPSSDVTIVSDADVVICQYSLTSSQIIDLTTSPNIGLSAVHLFSSGWLDRRPPQLSPYISVLQPPPMAHPPLFVPRRIYLLQKGKSAARAEAKSDMVSIPRRRAKITNPEHPKVLWLFQSSSYGLCRDCACAVT
jgi:hypothetical protein